MSEFDADYFIEKFEAIPDNLWICCTLGNYGEAHCALGHCGASANLEWSEQPKEVQALDGLFRGFGDYNTVTRINDGDNPHYQQSTPKARVLAALIDIKEKGGLTRCR